MAAMQRDLRLEPGSADIFGVGFAGNDPRYHWSIRSGFDLPGNVTVDVAVRQVGRLREPAVDAYLEADTRVAWQVRDQLSLSITGLNLLHDQHLEFVNPSLPRSEVPRSVTLAAHWIP
jgi:iron complex outermembrane receptor protein